MKETMVIIKKVNELLTDKKQFSSWLDSAIFDTSNPYTCPIAQYINHGLGGMYRVIAQTSSLTVIDGEVVYTYAYPEEWVPDFVDYFDKMGGCKWVLSLLHNKK